MGDFFQNGTVTTFHNLTDRPVEELERELLNFSQSKPLGIILPSLFSELEGPALKHIVSELKKVPYLSQIVIGLDKANAEQFAMPRNTSPNWRMSKSSGTMALVCKP